MEAAKPPAVMRAKLERPEASGMRAGGTPSSRMVIMARKNVAMAIPWTAKGTMKSKNEAWSVRPARRKNETAKAIKAALAISRASIRDIIWALSGVSRIAITPGGAATRPAQVAV